MKEEKMRAMLLAVCGSLLFVGLVAGCGLGGFSERKEAPTEPPPPQGWYNTGIRGVFASICRRQEKSPECVAAEQQAGGSALVIKIWCKERPCGTIYIKANQVTKDGAVMGWTNAMGGGEMGQTAYLALRYYSEEGVFAAPDITEFTIGGEPAKF